MRLQLADGPCRRPIKRRLKALSDENDIFGKIVEGVKKVASNPKVQEGVKKVVQSGILKRKSATPGATFPDSPYVDIVNQITGTTEAHKLQVENLEAEIKRLRRQRLLYGGVGIGIGMLIGYGLSSMGGRRQQPQYSFPMSFPINTNVGPPR